MSEGHTDDAAVIRNLIESWAAAVRAGNLDGILAHHSPDMLMFDVPPPFESKGLDEYRKTWDLYFSWSRETGVFDIDEMNVTAGRDVAFATARMRCEGTEPNEQLTSLDFRLTVGLRKIDGQWRIVHEHHSIPAT